MERKFKKYENELRFHREEKSHEFCWFCQKDNAEYSAIDGIWEYPDEYPCCEQCKEKYESGEELTVEVFDDNE